MDEKKLTDEEIVKAVECCTELGNCGKCPYRLNKIDCVADHRHEKDIFDLIQRLQGEKAELQKQVKQAIKDTAKEIYYHMAHAWYDKEMLKIFREYLKERFSVEVE